LNVEQANVSFRHGPVKDFVKEALSAIHSKGWEWDLHVSAGDILEFNFERESIYGIITGAVAGKNADTTWLVKTGRTTISHDA
jgi:hypothetical protein